MLTCSLPAPDNTGRVLAEREGLWPCHFLNNRGLPETRPSQVQSCLRTVGRAEPRRHLVFPAPKAATFQEALNQEGMTGDPCYRATAARGGWSGIWQ